MRERKDPNGTVQELAEVLGQVASSTLAVPLAEVLGQVRVRGASINGAQVHSVRLPGFIIAFETLFGLPDERLSIRRDAGSGAALYAAGTLLAVRKVMELRCLDQLLSPAWVLKPWTLTKRPFTCRWEFLVMACAWEPTSHGQDQELAVAQVGERVGGGGGPDGVDVSEGVLDGIGGG